MLLLSQNYLSSSVAFYHKWFYLFFIYLFYISNHENKKFKIKKVLLINPEYFIINQMLFKMTFTLYNLLKIVQISIILKFI